MHFTLEFDMDNAAFDDNHHLEAARLLKRAATLLEQHKQSGALLDFNGNLVGRWDISGTHPDDEEE